MPLPTHLHCNTLQHTAPHCNTLQHTTLSSLMHEIAHSPSLSIKYMYIYIYVYTYIYIYICIYTYIPVCVLADEHSGRAYGWIAGKQLVGAKKCAPRAACTRGGRTHSPTHSLQHTPTHSLQHTPLTATHSNTIIVKPCNTLHRELHALVEVKFLKSQLTTRFTI